MDAYCKLGIAAKALQACTGCGRFLLLLLGALALSAAAQAQTDATRTPAPAEAQAAAPDPAELRKRIDSIGRRGFLYELTRGPQRLFLYGTCTACKPEHFPLNPPLMQALAGSASLVVDVNYLALPPQLQAELDAIGALPPPHTLERQLAAESLARLQQALPVVGLALPAVNKLAPWMASLVLSSRHLAQQGYQYAQNTSLYLLGYARGRQLPVVELEGPVAQLRLLAAAPAAVSSDYLDRTVRDVLSNRLKQKQELLVEQGWLVGDAAGVQRYNAVEAAGESPWGAYYREQWLAARNRAFVARLDSGSPPLPAMVALPAQNLFGSTGVLALLQAAGYTARDLQGAPAAASR